MSDRLPVTVNKYVIWLLLILCGCLSGSLLAKEKVQAVDTNDPTYRLFLLLDSTRGGKLADFYLLADVYKDPKNPDQELQHVLRVDYDKNRFFGKFRIYVRSVAKLTPEQLGTYTPEKVYEFGASDSEKFEKIEPAPFGQRGDLYLRAEDDRPLSSAPITEDVKKAYEVYLTQYVLPALQKK